MKNIFKSIISIALISAICSCKTHNVQVSNTEQTYGYSVAVTKASISKPDTLSSEQMDSVVSVNKLPAIAKWATSTFKDEELNKGYVYKTLYDKTTNTIYTVKLIEQNVYVLSKKTISVR